MVLISVILPTYNEKDNIIPLINKLTRVIAKITPSYEIVVVDDNSPDKTASYIKSYANSDSNIKLFVRRNGRGLAKSIHYGIKRAKGKILIVMDSDFNHDPIIIPQMIRLLDFYDLVIGSRYVFGGGMDDKTREKASYFYNLFVRILLKTRVNDNLSGFFAIKSENLFRLDLTKIFKGYGDYFIRLIVQAKSGNYKFIEIPTWYNIRKYGESKSNAFTMILQYTKTVIEIRRDNSITLKE